MLKLRLFSSQRLFLNMKEVASIALDTEQIKVRYIHSDSTYSYNYHSSNRDQIIEDIENYAKHPVSEL